MRSVPALLRPLLLTACAALAVPGGAAEPQLPQASWDRALALRTAAIERDTAAPARWLELLWARNYALLANELEAWAAARTPSAPAREAAVLTFTIALADLAPGEVPDALLDQLEQWPLETLVPHEENPAAAVPLYNIPAAARGVRGALLRRQGYEQAETLLGAGPDAWLRGFRAAPAGARSGFLDALALATAAQRKAIAARAVADAAANPASAAVAARAVPSLADPDAALAALLAAPGADVATLLRASAQHLPPPDRAQLLLGAIAAAPPERAALAIGLLAPGLAGEPAVVESLRDLLEHPLLRASAALALARLQDQQVAEPPQPLATALAVTAAEPRIVEWVESAPADDPATIALGYPAPLPADTPLPFDGFRSYAGLHARHQDLAAHSPWVHGTVVGTTLYGREIWAYRLGDEDLERPGGAPEPALLTNGGIHAREWQTPEIVTGIMELMAERSGDAHLWSYLRDHANIIVVPVLNVDGFLQTQRYPTQNWLGTDIDAPQDAPRDGRMRRKNLRGADEDLLTQDDHLEGVDLNRNNAPYWDTNPNRSSDDTRSLVHHGSAPASEPEIVALAAAAQLGPSGQLSLYTDVHSFAQTHFWVRNDNNRLANQTEAVLRTFTNFHSAYPAGKVYAYNTANNVPRNNGIGATDEYFLETYFVPSWTLEVEPSGGGGTHPGLPGGGADYGGLGRNGHDGFILPESEMRRVRTELAETFGIVYYRQSGPPSVAAMRVADAATGAIVYAADWDTDGPERRSLHEFTAQPLQLDRDYRAWIAFDKPMRWREDGATVALPGQAQAALEVDHDLVVDGSPLLATVSNERWPDAPAGDPAGYRRYLTDALAFDFRLGRSEHNLSLVGDGAAAVLNLSAFDMTSLRTDADPATIARWQLGGWQDYENSSGVDGTDSGGTDRTLAVEVTGDDLGDPFVIEPGTSSAWYDPSRAGEGFMLEILPAGRAVAYWFTYDDAGEQDWYIAVGTIEGNRIRFPELLRVSGGVFGPGYDPDQVSEAVVGSAEFLWSGCDDGAMSWRLNGPGAGRTGRMQLIRLSRVMGIDCGLAALPPERPEGRLSGSWYDPARAGEGFTVEVLIDSRVLVYWFGYDTGGARRWFFGVGTIADDGRLVFPDMLTTAGGVFGDGFDPAEVRELPWGALELDLGCDAGFASFVPSEPGFPAGELQLTRLTTLHGLGCSDD